MVTFVLGLMLSVPLAVVANLVTPHVKNVIARRSKRRARNRAEVLRLELARVDRYVQEPHTFNQHLLGVVLATTAVTAVSTFIAGTSFTVAELLGFQEELEETEEVEVGEALREDDFDADSVVGSVGYDWVPAELLYLAGPIVGTVGALIVTLLAMNARRLLRRVNDYDDYRSSAEAVLASLNSAGGADGDGSTGGGSR